MPQRSSEARVAVIGAGMAGISCADALRQRGIDVTLFEKSRGIGGRLATRRNDAGDSFDHGAQYITTQSDDFAEFIDGLRQQGAAAIWQPSVDDTTTAHRHPWLVGSPGMNALLEPRAEPLDIRLNTQVAALRRHGDRWQLQVDDGTLPDLFDIVISTAPAVQTHALYDPAPDLQQPLAAVAMAPCWALLITFRTPLPVDFEARRFEHGITAWLAKQDSRPGRAQGRQAWILHASTEWSAANLELTPAQALVILERELSRAIGGALPDIVFTQAHRWRHAMTTQPLGQPFIASADQTLYAGGDWCLGARVECAYRSGVTIAQAVANTLGAG